jgi:hypothetical protein
VLLGAVSLSAQDVLSIGTGSAASGGVASVPVSILDRSGTALGSDAGSGKRIQGIAFKVMYPTALVSSVTFTRTGVAAPLTPLLETTVQGSGFMAYIVSFSELSNPIPLTLNAATQIGTLNVTLQASAPNGSSAALTFHAPSTLLSNQGGTTSETVAAGNLELTNGNAICSLASPTSLIATSSGTSQVNVTWSAVPVADHYEVWRNNAFLMNAPAASYTDNSVAAGTTYLYKARAVGAAGTSAFSNVDAATTIVFTDNELIRAVHITELRTAVNAFRAAAGLGSMGGDATIGAGLPIRAQHILDLRTALNEARAAAAMSALTYTDSSLTLALIRAVHVQELRLGVR